MAEKVNYLECWTTVAAALLSQALAGEPTLIESLPKPMGSNPFGFCATLKGEEEGRFSVLLDGSLDEASLLGEGVDQKAAWQELLREIADAAAGELLAKTGRKAHVTTFTPIDGESKLSRAFQLKAGTRSWAIQVNSTVAAPKLSSAAAEWAENDKTTSTRNVPDQVEKSGAGKTVSEKTESGALKDGETAKPASKKAESTLQDAGPAGSAPGGKGATSGFELLFDVELEASLRFGAREMPLGEILGLGPGDVVQLDRHITDPVELIVGDKIVARGEVVLVEGNFALRVTEVAAPQNRLESIRCLF